MGKVSTAKGELLTPLLETGIERCNPSKGKKTNKSKMDLLTSEGHSKEVFNEYLKT